MENLEPNMHRLFGEVSCMSLVMQVLIQTHPNKAALSEALGKLSDDVPDLVAFNHPGRPAIDRAFRNALEVFQKSAALQLPAKPVRFPGFGTGSGAA
jgi:hypothetical protein